MKGIDHKDIDNWCNLKKSNNKEPIYKNIIYSTGSLYLNGEYTKKDLIKLLECFDKRTKALEWAMSKVTNTTIDKTSNK